MQALHRARAHIGQQGKVANDGAEQQQYQADAAGDLQVDSASGQGRLQDSSQNHGNGPGYPQMFLLLFGKLQASAKTR